MGEGIGHGYAIMDAGGLLLYYKVTVFLACGDVVEITTNCLERTLMDVEQWYGDALESYTATKAEDYRFRGGGHGKT